MGLNKLDTHTLVSPESSELIDNEGDNRVLTSKGPDAAINAEEGLTFDGVDLKVLGDIVALLGKSQIWSAIQTYSAQIAASGAPNIGASGARFGTIFGGALDVSGDATIT